MEKRGWVAWFTRETNKTSRQEVCTTYVGRRHSPKGEETLRPPRSDLRSPGIISKHGGFHAPDGDSARVWERERHGETSISSNWSQFFIFHGLLFFFLDFTILYWFCHISKWIHHRYIHWDVMQKSRGVSSPDFYQSQVLHTNVYRGLRGVTSSSGQGACWQFTTLSLWQWSVNQDTYFSRGDYS